VAFSVVNESRWAAYHRLDNHSVCRACRSRQTPLKTKTWLRKAKSHSVQFEDDIWCQLYRLGYRQLNIDETFCLPFGPNTAEKYLAV